MLAPILFAIAAGAVIGDMVASALEGDSPSVDPSQLPHS